MCIRGSWLCVVVAGMLLLKKQSCFQLIQACCATDVNGGYRELKRQKRGPGSVTVGGLVVCKGRGRSGLLAGLCQVCV